MALPDEIDERVSSWELQELMVFNARARSISSRLERQLVTCLDSRFLGLGDWGNDSGSS